MTDVFISYSRKDKDRVYILATALEAKGWSVWWDREIVPGQTFDQVIEHELETSKTVVVLWSNSSISSEWVKNEAAVGVERGILVPALIDNVKLPLEFRRKQTANLVGWNGDLKHAGFQELCSGIATAASMSHIPPFQSANSQTPRFRRSLRWKLGVIGAIITALGIGIFWSLSPKFILHSVNDELASKSDNSDKLKKIELALKSLNLSPEEIKKYLHETTLVETASSDNSQNAVLSKANYLILLSQIGYLPEDEIKNKIFNELDLYNLQYIQTGDYKGFITFNDKVMILIFNYDKIDHSWLSDSKFELIDGPFGRVNSAVSTVLDSGWPMITEILRKHNTASQLLFITGHGLGGAIATLAAARLYKEKGYQPEVYTFGAPRIGDSKFNQEFNTSLKSRLFRFVNEGDVIPLMPPEKLGYSHAGTLVFFDKEGKLKDISTSWKVLTGESNTENSVDHINLDNLKTHGISIYLEYIKKNLGK